VTIQITLPDGTARAAPDGTTPRAIAQGIGPRLAQAALAARVNDQVWDLDRPLHEDARVAILTETDPAALEVLRHSAAHVLATAVRQLFPEAKIGFGPAIEDGFYYDFEVPRPFTPRRVAGSGTTRSSSSGWRSWGTTRSSPSTATARSRICAADPTCRAPAG
jgi:threonyl-tRNA synthetase